MPVESLRVFVLTACFLLLAHGVPTARGQEAPDDEDTPGAEATAKPAKKQDANAQYISSSKPGAARVRLFILSGQSNMYRMDPDLSFTPTVRAHFPEDDVVVVKDAKGSQPIRSWLADWEPAGGFDKSIKDRSEDGALYDRLQESIATAMAGKPRPESVVFVWMQGETDAKNERATQVYETSVQRLFQRIRKDLEAPTMPIIVGRITDHFGSKYPGRQEVRTIQDNLPKSDPLITVVDTDDLNGADNNIHFTKEGYYTLGERFAKAAISALSAR